MTIPDSIKEEIEKKAEGYAASYDFTGIETREDLITKVPELTRSAAINAFKTAATQFYARGVAACRWVSIEEKLPEYLTTVMLYENDECWWGYYGHDKRFHYFFGDIIREDKIFTHWQPIPKKPEDLK